MGLCSQPNSCSSYAFRILCVTTLVVVVMLYKNEERVARYPSKIRSAYIVVNSTSAKVIQNKSLLTNQPTQSTKNINPLIGYMIGLDFSDQGTSAFANLMSLLCLSSELGGVRVVEPFLVGSRIGLDVGANWTDQVMFSDVFDSGEFHRYAKSKGFGSLVPFETFLKNTPRKVVTAQYKCTGYHVCRTCGHEDVLKQGRTFARLNGFEMVGHICLDYGSKGLMNLTEFKSQLYRKYNKSEVVVMFPIFGGVEPGKTSELHGFRLNMSPSKCQRSNLWQVNSHIKPSGLPKTSAENYINKFLNRSNHYMSVMVRFEMVLGSKNFTGIKDCFDHLNKKVQEVKSEFGIEHVVLCLDVGKYGSYTYQHYYDKFLPQINSLISQTVKEGMNLTDLDKMYTDTALKPNAGFVAVMQKVIAARGEVLVLLGGGSSYQRSTESMYKSLHKKNISIVKLTNSCG